MKRITICGRDFELQNGTVARKYITNKTIYDCYATPSSTKVAIFEDWKKWFIDNGSYEFGICSHNCNFFSIEGTIEQDGTEYYLYITYAHNRAYIIAD